MRTLQTPARHNLAIPNSACPKPVHRVRRLTGPLTALALFATAVLSATPPAAANSTDAAPTALAPLMGDNGSSGYALVPAARTLPAGSSTVSYSSAIPGSPAPSGHNVQVGFGLTPELELVGRLATQDWNCNMFAAGQCPPNTLRDLSASLKWSPRWAWLQSTGTHLALGATDLGGAATNFRSYYASLQKGFGPLEVTVGAAQGQQSTSPLRGGFAGVTWAPLPHTVVGLQRVGNASVAHAGWGLPLGSSGLAATVAVNHNLQSVAYLPRSWASVGLSVPLDRGTGSRSRVGTRTEKAAKKVQLITEGQLPKALQAAGFYSPIVTRSPKGEPVVVVENTAYAWNHVDAAGVALGIAAGAFGHGGALPVRTAGAAEAASDPRVHVVVTYRGLQQLWVSAPAACARRWLEGGEPCAELTIRSLAERGPIDAVYQPEAADLWRTMPRPELLVSPVLASTVGTELGSFDYHLGVNVNGVLPLWKGAVLDVNRLVPTGLNSDNFSESGIFAASRLRERIDRRMFHQSFNLAELNSQGRVSFGHLHDGWQGQQVEWQSHAWQGRLRASYVSGYFSKLQTLDVLEPTWINRHYQLSSVRASYGHGQILSTELTTGKYWGQDTGTTVTQRFWLGDTSVALFVRRTQKVDDPKPVSFAGLQVSIPFTPRKAAGAEPAGLRGTRQWGYTVESRIRNKENFITGGYGSIPAMGESLQQQFNRDRFGSGYLQGQAARLRNAFQTLAENP